MGRQISRASPKAKSTNTATLLLAKSPQLENIKPFDRKVYEKCSQIPAGKVSTYKDLANAIGNPGAFRAVGSALKRNPFAPQVPCHRVVASDLSLGGFYGSTDRSGALLLKKFNMLREEGVEFDESTIKRVKKDSVHSFETQSRS